MTLNCGNSAAVDALNSVRDDIKNALAQGKDAIGDLEAKASEAIAKLNEVKVPIPSVAVPNLQEDINSVVTQATTDINTAIAELPAKIAEFQSTWGDVLSDSEVQGYIDKMTEVVTQAVTDPTSLLDFDPCKEFPNKDIETTVNSAGESITKAVEQAKAVEVPTINPVTVEESAAVVQTVTAHEDIQPDKKPSTASPSKLSYFDVMKNHSVYADAVILIKNTHHQDETDVVSIKIEKFEEANAAYEDEIMDLETETGKNIKTMISENIFPDYLIKYIDEYDAMVDEYGIVDARVAVIETLMIGLKGTFTGDLEMKDFQPTLDSFLSGGITGQITDSDIAVWKKIEALMYDNQQVIIDFEYYLGRNKPRPSWSLPKKP